MVGRCRPTSAVDDEQNILRWEPWVRTSLALTELMAEVLLVNTATGLRMDWRANPLIELDRPTVNFSQGSFRWYKAGRSCVTNGRPKSCADRQSDSVFGAVTGLNPTKHRWTMEWLNAGLQLAVAVEMRFKHALACPRPVELSSQVQPVITTPLHGTYPMGHAAQAFLVAYSLQRLMGWRAGDAGTTQLQRVAARHQHQSNRRRNSLSGGCDRRPAFGPYIGGVFHRQKRIRQAAMPSEEAAAAELGRWKPEEKISERWSRTKGGNGDSGRAVANPRRHGQACARAQRWQADLASRIPAVRLPGEKKQ